PIGEEEDSHLGDFIEDKSILNPAESVTFSNLREITDEVLATLTPREEKVIKMRFGLGNTGSEHTLEEVGQHFAVTRERIRQMEAHQDRIGGLFLDRKFADPLDKPFLCLESKAFLRWQPIGIAAETVGLGNAIEQVGLDLACEPPKCTITDRFSGFVIFARLQV